MTAFFIFMILNENVNISDINLAIDNHQCVVINYAGDDNTHTGSRMIEVYAYGLTSVGNPVIRAFERYGDTKTVVPMWKYFRLDRISSWRPTEQRFSRPANEYYPSMPSFNENGDNSMSVVYKIAKFDDGVPEEPQNGPRTKSDTVFQTDSEKEIAKKTERLKQQLNNPIKIDDFKRTAVFKDVPNTKPTGSPRLKDNAEPTGSSEEETYKTDTERGLERLRQQLENPITLDDYLNRKTTNGNTTASTQDNAEPTGSSEEETYKTDTERGLERLRQQLENPQKIDLSKIQDRRRLRK